MARRMSFDLNKWLAETRVVMASYKVNARKVEIIDVRPRIVCKDGYSLSVQANEFTYCLPRTNEPPYTHVEVGYPTTGDSLIDEYTNEGGGVYGYVPVSVVETLIMKHGGYKGADNSNRTPRARQTTAEYQIDLKMKEALKPLASLFDAFNVLSESVTQNPTDKTPEADDDEILRF